MSITVTITDQPIYVTVDEANNTVTLNQSDNPITVTTSTDLITALGLASDVTYTQTGTLPGGNVQDALADLADQFFRQSSTPSGDNLAEGDLWYNTSTDELLVYRQVSGGFEFHVIASAGGSSPTAFTLDGGSFQENRMATNIIKIKRTTGSTAPSSLNAGELAFSGGAGTQSNMGQRLFIGDPANSNAVTVIGGNYFTSLMDHAHGTTTASSVLIVDANKSVSEIRTAALHLGTSGSDTLVTATATEINSALDGITSTAAELNLLDGSTASGIVASKAIIADSNKDISGGRNITITGTLAAPTLDISGNIDIDGVANLDNTDIDGSLTVDGAVDINATTFDIDATDDIDIDTTDTTGGIAIGTANSGVPVSIGHTTSEVTVNDNLTVTGDLTVSGTTTTVNSTTVSIKDPIFELGDDSSDDNLDRGLKLKYNNGANKFAFMGFDDSDGKFAFIPDATDTSNVFSGTQGTLKANIEAGNTGITVGSSVPFSDSSGTLTLQNIDAIDATTETTLEAAIDSLTNLTAVGTLTTGTWNATTIAVGSGGTGLTAPGSSGQILVSNGTGFVSQNIDGGTYS